MSDTCDVLVVGAGPVGATAALLLAGYGLKCTVVEARREPQSHPAAHVLSTRSMEIWREIGFERDIRRLSAPIHELRCIAYCTTLAGPELGRVPLADLPDAQMDAIELVSPTRSAHLSQNVLEPLLWKHLRDSARIDLRTGCQYRFHTDDAHGVFGRYRGHHHRVPSNSHGTLCHRGGRVSQHGAAGIGGHDGGPRLAAHDQRAFLRRSRTLSPPPPRPGDLDPHRQGSWRRHRAPIATRPRISNPLFPAVRVPGRLSRPQSAAAASSTPSVTQVLT